MIQVKITELYIETEKEWKSTKGERYYFYDYEIENNIKVKKNDEVSLYLSNSDTSWNGVITEIQDNEIQFYIY